MRRVVLGALLAGLCACAGEVTGVETTGTSDSPEDPVPPPAPPAEVEVRFEAPASGAAFGREAGVDERGRLLAMVAVDVVATGGAQELQLFVDGIDTVLAAGGGASLDATLEFATDGPRTLIAVALDSTGEEVGRASVAIDVIAPAAQTCLEWLDLYRLDYELGPDRPGIDTPVTVTPPISGIAYRYVTADQPRKSMLMDCSLALALLQTAPSLHARDIVEVADIGIYDYRCIGNEGTPPDCPRGVSQHAFANAIDIAGYTDFAGLFYSVNDDWIIDPDDEPTCEAPTEPGADKLLHELICEQKFDGIWNIVLTPNYNAGHRNHFHVDLKDGSDFIELWGGPPAMDEGGPAH